MRESKRLVAELGHIQSFLEGKAGMTVGQGKMLLLNWANVAREAAVMLKEQEPVKKAFWIRPTYQDCHCSRCENQPEYEPGESVPLYPYCPYCGAEMEVKWDA